MKQSHLSYGFKFPVSPPALILFMIFTLCLPVSAFGSGFYLPGRGAYTLGRAGASIAGNETLQSIWYNPANLAALKRWNLLLDASLVFAQVEYTRAPRVGGDGQTIEYPTVSNEAPPTPPPSLMAAYGWKKQRVTLAFGIYAPMAAGLKFPDTGPQRYSLVDMSQSLFVVSHLAVGWAPHPRFRIGAGLQNFSMLIRLQAAASGYLGLIGAAEDRNLDLYNEMDMNAPLNISGNVGLWGRVLETKDVQLDLAVSIQMPVQVKAEGTLVVRLPTHALFDTAKLEGKEIEAEFTLPLIARAAIRLSLFKRFDLEVAFVFENWAVHDQIKTVPKGKGIRITNFPGIGDYKVPPIQLQRNFKDSFSIRIGGGATLLDWLQMRLGYAFETTAIPDEYHSLFLVDADKHLIGLGFSFSFRYATIDLSYAFILQHDRSIRNSKYTQINPLNPEGALVVGDGDYQSSFHVAALGVRFHF